jgi:D-alanyl-D-alanine carboxypeptidase
MITRCAVLVVLLVGSAIAQSSTPDTAAGKVLATWLASFNSGDSAALSAFDATYRRQSRPVSSSLTFREWTGGFTLIRLEKNEPLALTALLQERNSDQIARFELALASDNPPNIVREQFMPIPHPPDLAIPRLDEPGALAALSEFAEKATMENRFSGVVLVARRGNLRLHKAWGRANRDSGVPASLETQFDIASVSKMFTAVATLQLIEAGRLSLHGTVGTYLPDYPNHDVASNVTIRHLLTHTGGTGDVFGQPLSTMREHADYVTLLGTRALLFAPGTEYRYSNYGFILLGSIIERVSGMSYYDYIQRRIFEPAGMQSTDFLATSAPARERAVGHVRRNGAWVAADPPWGRAMAFGGAYATAHDLFRFVQALESGKLITRDTLADATQPHQRQYGYGFNLQGSGMLRYYGHAGGAPGRNGEVRIYPEIGYVVIGLTNLEPPLAERVIDVFANRMPITR